MQLKREVYQNDTPFFIFFLFLAWGLLGVVWHGSCRAILWTFGTAVALKKNGQNGLKWVDVGCRSTTIETHNNTTETNTMKTTTIDALIALFAVVMIVVPMGLIAVQDFCRFNPFKSRRRK